MRTQSVGTSLKRLTIGEVRTSTTTRWAACTAAGPPPPPPPPPLWPMPMSTLHLTSKRRSSRPSFRAAGAWSRRREHVLAYSCSREYP